jgi:hypothetical protein
VSLLSILGMNNIEAFFDKSSFHCWAKPVHFYIVQLTFYLVFFQPHS